MPLGTFGQGLGPYWGVVLPVEKVNLMDANPSFELGTTGAGAIESATLGTACDQGYQAFGAWSLQVSPTTNGTSGVYVGTFAAGQGTEYTVSAYVWATDGLSYILGVANTSNALQGSIAFTGGGTWHRYQYSYQELSSQNRRVIVRKASGGNANPFWVDGVQAEVGSMTTYIDGEQEGCLWLSAPHQSLSQRSGQSRAGGSIVALADLGFAVNDALGVGMPPVENNSQSYAILDGAEFQRQRAAPRMITLTSLIDGNTQQDYHANRRRIIDAIKMDAVSTQQPVRFVYIGAGGTSYLDAVYQAGLEGGDQTGFTEQVGVQFIAYDPYWRAERDTGTTLAPRTNLGSVNYIAYRDGVGRWGTMGDSVNNTVLSLMTLPNGALLVGGAFTTAGGTAGGRYLAQWSSGQWGTLVGGTTNNYVSALTRNPAGTVFAGGAFTAVAGTASAKYLAQYVPTASAWGTLAGGTVDNEVFALEYSKFGTLFAGGSLVTAGGTQARYIAQYTGAWGTLVGGTVNGQVFDIQSTLSGTVYAVGGFGSAGAVPARGIARWTVKGWGSVGGTWAAETAGVYGQTLYELVNKTIAVGGYFVTIGTTASSGTYNEIAIWNGASWGHLGSGLGTSNNEVVYALAQDQIGNIWAGGVIKTTNNAPSQSNLVRFIGNTWLPGDLLIPPTLGNACRALIQTSSGTMYVGGAFSGTMQAASVTPIVNAGMAQAFPRVQMRNTGAGTARVYHLANNTANTTIYFDLILLGGETVTIDMDTQTITSDVYGNLFSVIRPGSKLNTWRLLPGTNQISYMTDSDSVVTAIYHRPRQWSADGTI